MPQRPGRSTRRSGGTTAKDRLMYRSWFDLGFDIWTLGVEASTVIALRTSNAMMGGDLGGRETRLMIGEKMIAVMELQSAFVTSGLGVDPAAAARKLLRSYTRKVRANRLRLS